MKLNIPSKLRAALYIFTALGTPVIIYLRAKGYIGELEVALWGGEVTVINTMAALNTPIDNKEPLDSDA